MKIACKCGDDCDLCEKCQETKCECFCYLEDDENEYHDELFELDLDEE